MHTEKFVYGLHPNNSTAINCMVNMHWMNLDIEQTLSMSRKALEINPYDAATIFSNAVAKAQNGDFDSALSSWKVLLRLIWSVNATGRSRGL
ncbi:MAG: hypothetical protein P8M25_13405 [Paracoccaceae bacterium]|nr:hypothetical protein [Paracoccaceae bacterium]